MSKLTLLLVFLPLSLASCKKNESSFSLNSDEAAALSNEANIKFSVSAIQNLLDSGELHLQSNTQMKRFLSADQFTFDSFRQSGNAYLDALSKIWLSKKEDLVNQALGSSHSYKDPISGQCEAMLSEMVPTDLISFSGIDHRNRAQAELGFASKIKEANKWTVNLSVTLQGLVDGKFKADLSSIDLKLSVFCGGQGAQVSMRKVAVQQ